MPCIAHIRHVEFDLICVQLQLHFCFVFNVEIIQLTQSWKLERNEGVRASAPSVRGKT